MLEPVVATVVAWAWLGESLSALAARRARWSCSRRSCSRRPLGRRSLDFPRSQRWARRPIGTEAAEALAFSRTGRCELRRVPSAEPQRAIERARRADPPSGGLSRFLRSPLARCPPIDLPRGAQGASRVAARLLRRCRAGGRDGRSGARALRPARLRAQADRPQPARRARARGPRRDLRRGRGGGSESGRPSSSRPTASRRRCT